tara:strand:- start:3004 stop:3495 length:492 start_codon:yes stop_codon:yes gene_type:complete
MKDRISGILLLLAIIYGNFLSVTVGKKANQVITNNIYIVYFIVFACIYFTVHFTDSDITHPSEHLLHSFYLFVLYILFMRSNKYVSIIVFILIIVNFLVDTYIRYYEKQDNADKFVEKITELTKYSQLLTSSIILLVGIGFLINVYRNSKAKNCSFKDFILYG